MISERKQLPYINPVVEMISRNLERFGLRVSTAKTAIDFHNNEAYNLIKADNTIIKLIPNSSGTAFTTFIDTSVEGCTKQELMQRIEEFVKAYISVLFLYTVLTPEDIECIKNGEPYNKNGIQSIIDRKSDSLYVTIFDSNNRLENNLLAGN